MSHVFSLLGTDNGCKVRVAELEDMVALVGFEVCNHQLSGVLSGLREHTVKLEADELPHRDCGDPERGAKTRLLSLIRVAIGPLGRQDGGNARIAVFG